MKKLNHIGFTYIGAVILVLSGCNIIVKKDIARVWQMEDGLVIIEAESAKYGEVLPGKWQMVPDSIKGYTGNTAYIWTGEGNMYRDPLVHDAPKTSHDYRLLYEISVPEAGDYEIKVRNYHWLEDGDNDLWISINESFYKKMWDHDTRQWTWTEAIGGIDNDQTIQLNEGINTIEILGRSKGMIVDRIAIFKTGTPEERWSDLSLTESDLVLPGKRDNKAPSTPKNLRGHTITTSTISLTWDGSTDNFKVYGYFIYTDEDKWVDIAFDNSYILTGLEEAKQYAYYIKAIDFNGNLSDASNTINFSTEAFNSNEGVEIKYVQIPPTIDGAVDGLWSELNEYPINNICMGTISNKEDLSGNFKIAWDESYIYLIVNVQDDYTATSEGTYDGVNIYLDLNNSKDLIYSYNDRIYRFTLSLPKNEGLFPSYTALIDRDNFVKGLLQETAITGNGYLIEAAFPWHSLGIIPNEGDLLGLEIVINDYDATLNREGSMSWSVKDYDALNMPYNLGDAKLTGLYND